MRQVIDGAFIAMLEARDLRIKKPMNGLFGGTRRAKVYGSSAEFADYREYHPGDDLRRVDWNLYARFEKLYLRLYTDERRLHHRIYLDASASMDWGEPSKADTALKLAAALGYLAVQSMDRVSFYAVNERYLYPLARAVSGREAFYRAADVLNRVRFFGESDLGAAIPADENPGRGDGISVILSDFLTDSWQGAVDYLCSRGREVQLIQVLSRDEIAPGYAGKVFLLDAEAIDEEDTRNYKTEITRTSMKAYEEAFTYHEQTLRDYCGARTAGFFTVCTDDGIERMLFSKAAEAGVVL
ncbi:MAG: DUF58 domain-containing protein [Clostridia bacterium]|nr:DUF58 domain-containing protein [Clostridia bacterium]